MTMRNGFLGFLNAFASSSRRALLRMCFCQSNVSEAEPDMALPRWREAGSLALHLLALAALVSAVALSTGLIALPGSALLAGLL